MIFVNREKELAQLEDLYTKSSKEAQLLILYGKRRVGKTELVKKFLTKKEGVYFLATHVSGREQLNSATEQFAEYFGDDYIARNSMVNWQSLFKYIGTKLDNLNKPLVIVFDEFPYMAEGESAISSLFQYGWDEVLKHKQVFLILMGSSINMMYKHALQYSAPLYGRRSATLLLEPFDYSESSEFLRIYNENPDYTFEQLFPCYALVGGIPAYLRQLNPSLTVEENLVQNILPADKYLNIEPELLLTEEFSEPQTYLTILKSIGLGKTKSSELANLLGTEASKLTYYINQLLSLRLISREVPVTESNPENSKKSYYSISDPFLRLYFSLLFTNKSQIEAGDLNQLVNAKKELITKLMAKSYEDISLELIKDAIKANKLPVFHNFGRYWGKDFEIDLVGLNKETNSALFVETKYSKNEVDVDVYWELVEYSKLMKWGDDKTEKFYSLISRSGFTKKMIKLALEKNVVLIIGCEVLNK
jgi:uncharacterized protein